MIILKKYLLKKYLVYLTAIAVITLCWSCNSKTNFSSSKRPAVNTDQDDSQVFVPDGPQGISPNLPNYDPTLPSIPSNPTSPIPIIPNLTPNDYSCQAGLQLRSLSKTPFSGNNFGSQKYQEVMEYAFNQPLFRHFTSFREANVDVHETLHGYASFGTGIFDPYSPNKYHFLYHKDGKGIELARSKTRKQDMIQYIPRSIQQLYSVSDSSFSSQNFASVFFQTYITQQMNDGQIHHSQAGHLFEEWVCYIHDATTLIELVNRGSRVSEAGSNFVATYFALAAAYTTAQVDRSYFNQTGGRYQLKKMFACLAEQAMHNYHTTPLKNQFSMRQNTYLYEHLKSSSESKHLRDFLYSWYGQAWVQRVFRF